MTAHRSAFVKALATGDFNNDHVTDVVISINRGDAQFSDDRGTSFLRILLANPIQQGGQGAATFAPNPCKISLPDDAFDLTTADLNADGNLDLVVTTDNDAQRGGLRLFLGRGDGTFGTGTTIDAADLFKCIPADLNGDGKSDLVSATAHELAVLLT